MNWYMHNSMSLCLVTLLSILLWMPHWPPHCPWISSYSFASHSFLFRDICNDFSIFLFRWSSFCFLCLTVGFLSGSSVQFSCLVMSDSLQPREPQHAAHPCPSAMPRVYPNSNPLSWWCHPIISSSVITFSSCSQPFPASGSFQMSQLFS